jgi:hypothetical protein
MLYGLAADTRPQTDKCHLNTKHFSICFVKHIRRLQSPLIFLLEFDLNVRGYRFVEFIHQALEARKDGIS